MLQFIAQECRRHPWTVPGVLLTASAALGTALPDLLAVAARVLS